MTEYERELSASANRAVNGALHAMSARKASTEMDIANALYAATENNPSAFIDIIKDAAFRHGIIIDSMGIWDIEGDVEDHNDWPEGMAYMDACDVLSDALDGVRDQAIEMVNLRIQELIDAMEEA